MPQENPREEFTRYYEQHKNAIFSYIYYRVGFNRYTAEDLTSDIFLKAFEHFDSFDRTRSFKAWIFTIAHNHLVNFYASRKEVLPLDESLNVVKETTTQEETDKNLTVSKILHLVTGLPENQRDLVVMRYVNDLSHAEIANILGKEEGAIRTALSRAVAALRNQYRLKFS